MEETELRRPRISSHYSSRQQDVIFGAICRIIDGEEFSFDHTHSLKMSSQSLPTAC